MNRLLVIGSNSIHTFNFIDLISPYFDKILLITNKINSDIQIDQIELSFNFSLNSILKTPSKIRQIVQDFNPSVIHVHQANSYAFFAALALGKRSNMVLTVWGSDVLLLPKKNLFWHYLVRFSVNKFCHFTADSYHLAEALNNLLEQKQEVLVVNFGIEPVDIQKSKEKLFYSNRLHKPLYRIDKIIHAFHKFHVKNVDSGWRLVIGATGNETEKLKKLVQNLKLENVVEFIGWVNTETNRNWYARSTFWISIPESDATSISLLEAMYYGCIPILSDLPSNREWIDDELGGQIVKDLDSDFLSQAFKLDFENAARINKMRIDKDGTKEANRLKFLKLYDQIKKVHP